MMVMAIDLDGGGYSCAAVGQSPTAAVNSAAESLAVVCFSVFYVGKASLLPRRGSCAPSLLNYMMHFGS